MLVFSVYKITNIKTGKIYIGSTQMALKKRLLGHATNKRGAPNLYSDIIAYGVDNFSIELIEECVNRENMLKRENYWINKMNAKDPSIGYNSNNAIWTPPAPVSEESISVANKIKNAIMTQKRLAQLTGIGEVRLSRGLNHEIDFTKEELTKIALILRIKL